MRQVPGMWAVHLRISYFPHTMNTRLPMRPQTFSRELVELADAFVPLIQRMLNAPDVVFSRPDALYHHVPQPQQLPLQPPSHTCIPQPVRRRKCAQRAI